MCDALTNEQTQLEQRLEEFNADTITLDEIRELGAQVAPFVSGLTVLALETSEESQEELHKRRHVLEHFFAAAGGTLAQAVHAKHSSLESSTREAKETMSEDEFTALVEKQQKEFNQYQYDIRTKHSAFIAGIINNIDEMDVMEILDVQSGIVIEAHKRMAMQRALGGLQGGLSELLSRIESEEGQTEETVH